MSRPEIDPGQELARIVTRVNDLDQDDAWWIISWIASGEPAVFDRAVQARARFLSSFGPGKGAA
jgi:hypothetical protein